jgi:NAD(P)-dependent dehydrogenase (short-subunit alcohol dehydrogenase family)
MARAFALNGALRVYLLGRRKELLVEAADEYPDTFVPIQCDVTVKDSLQAAIDKITADTGYINLLIANSGVVGPNGGWRPDLSLTEVRDLLWDEILMEGMTQTMHVNVTGAFYTMVAFLELLDAGNKFALTGNGFGRPAVPESDVLSVQSQVIFTGSISAFSRSFMTPPAYAASKAALLQLTKQASTNLAKFGIRVNALAPGCKWSVGVGGGVLS